MLTTDDLKKIQGAVREETSKLETKLEDTEARLRSVIREEVDKRAEETELKMEHRFNAVDKRFDGVDQRFDGIDKSLKSMKKHMEQDRRDWSAFFNEAGIFFDEMRSQLIKRIKKLEERKGFSKN